MVLSACIIPPPPTPHPHPPDVSSQNIYRTGSFDFLFIITCQFSHPRRPIVACVARATAICILHIVENFQKLFNDRGEIISNLGYSTSFPRNQKQQCRNRVHWGYKHLKYTFDKFAEKIDGRVLVLSPHVKACDFLGSVEFFFSETFHYNLSVARAKQLKETTSCKKATELPG